MTTQYIHQPVSLILIGPSQKGKSSFANQILGITTEAVGDGVNSCTNEVKEIKYIGKYSLTLTFVIDTPGLGDHPNTNGKEQSDEEVKSKVLEGIKLFCFNKRRKVILLFSKFLDDCTGSTKKCIDLANEIKKTLNGYGKCDIVLIFTYSNTIDLSQYPLNFKKKQDKFPTKLEKGSSEEKKWIKQLWEQWKKTRVDVYEKSLGTCTVLCCDMNEENIDEDYFLDISWRKVVRFFADNYPSIIPQIADYATNVNVRKEAGMLAKSLPAIFSIIGGAAVGFFVAPAASLVFGGILGTYFISWVGSRIFSYYSSEPTNSVPVIIVCDQKYVLDSNGNSLRRKKIKNSLNISKDSGMVFYVQLDKNDQKYKIHNTKQYISKAERNDELELVNSPENGDDFQMVFCDEKEGKKAILRVIKNKVEYYVVIKKSNMSTTTDKNEATDIRLVYFE